MVDLYDILIGDVIPESGVAISMGRNTYDSLAPTVPLHDIHSRSFELHDSGNSGVATYHAEQNRLEFNPSNSGAQPVTTNVTIDVYGNAGLGLSVGTFSPLAASFTTRYNSSPAVFSVLSSGIIQINMSGVYDFRHDVSMEDTLPVGRYSSTTRWARQRVGETGFTVINGTRADMTTRGATTSDRDSASVRFIQDNVQAGDLYFAFVEGGAGVSGPSTASNASRIVIEKVG